MSKQRVYVEYFCVVYVVVSRFWGLGGISNAFHGISLPMKALKGYQYLKRMYTCKRVF